MNTDNNASDYIDMAKIAEITGYKQPSKQCNTLRKWGVRFFVRHDGRPQTTWTSFNEGKISRDPSYKEPDFSVISRGKR